MGSIKYCNCNIVTSSRTSRTLAGGKVLNNGYGPSSCMRLRRLLRGGRHCDWNPKFVQKKHLGFTFMLIYVGFFTKNPQSSENLLKFMCIFWEGHKIWKISTLLLTGTTRTKVRYRFYKILWSSQNIWILNVFEHLHVTFVTVDSIIWHLRVFKYYTKIYEQI